jgi:hypothetical protein
MGMAAWNNLSGSNLVSLGFVYLLDCRFRAEVWGLRKTPQEERNAKENRKIWHSGKNNSPPM